MDVSKRQAQIMDINSALPAGSSSSNEENLEGENLIQTLVTLTGLPEGMAHDELDQILSMSGHQEKRSDLTLEELRAALLTYLEALDLEAAESGCSDH